MRRAHRFDARARAGWVCGFDSAGHAQPMHFADHRIAGDAVGKLAGDLAGAQSFEPEFAQEIHSFVGPGHSSPSSICLKVSLKLGSHDARNRRRTKAQINRRSTGDSGVSDVLRISAAARDVVVDREEGTLAVESRARVLESSWAFSTAASAGLNQAWFYRA